MAKTVDVPKERKLYLAKQFTQDSVNSLIKEINDINSHDDFLEKELKIHFDLTYERKPIEIFIDSYGGVVYQLLGLVGVIEKSKTPIHTIVTGCAMSCGFLLLINGHKRFVYSEHATVLYHTVSSGAYGKIADLEDRFEETERLQDIIETMTLKKTKITKKKLKQCYKEKTDWFIPAKEAIELGIVDGYYE